MSKKNKNTNVVETVEEKVETPVDEVKEVVEETSEAPVEAEEAVTEEAPEEDEEEEKVVVPEDTVEEVPSEPVVEHVEIKGMPAEECIETTMMLEDGRIVDSDYYDENGNEIVKHDEVPEESDKEADPLPEIKGSFYISIGKDFDDHKLAKIMERLDKTELNHITTATGEVLVGPFESAEDAIQKRKLVISKGLKGHVIAM